jgi:hypothetical protein
VVQIDLVPLLVAILGSGGIGAAGVKLIDGLLKIRSGMSARENKRGLDIVAQRDGAIAREAQAWKRVDAEAANRRAIQEYAARLRRQIILLGSQPEDEPQIEKTLTKTQLKELRELDP